MSYIETKTFIEVFPTESDFISNWTNSVYKDYITDTASLAIIYDLLLARFQYSHIADINTDSFKRKVNTILFSYAPTFLKKLDMQKTLRELSDDEIRVGTVGKFTRGYNPSDVPGTANSDTEIETVNEQSLNKYTKSILEGYTNLLDLLNTDIVSTFINTFKKLFMTIIDFNDILTLYTDGGSY